MELPALYQCGLIRSSTPGVFVMLDSFEVGSLFDLLYCFLSRSVDLSDHILSLQGSKDPFLAAVPASPIPSRKSLFEREFSR